MSFYEKKAAHYLAEMQTETSAGNEKAACSAMIEHNNYMRYIKQSEK